MNTPNSLIETLMRHGIGYDTLTRFPEVFSATTNFPPHDIEKLTEDCYRLTLAVAGWHRHEIGINLHQGMLTIDGKRASGEASEPAPKMLYHGIAKRDFTRQFRLGEHVKVQTATLKDGLLVIDLERQVPEELQPKTIVIA